MVVHGMLAAAATEQEIILEYSRGIEGGYYKGLTPLSGARVAVRGRDTFQFKEDPSRPGIYRAAFVPQPGERYTLLVQGPADEFATAETVVPGIPEIATPSRDTTITRGTDMVVQWSDVPAAGYTTVSSPPDQPTSVGSLQHVSILRDTALVVQLGTFGGNSFHLRIVAVDQNFVRYAGADPDGDQNHSRIRSTVEGAYGLFGSYGISAARRIALQ